MIDGPTLRHIRRSELKTTQEQLAAQLGVSVRTYCRYEKHGAPERVDRHLRLLRQPADQTTRPRIIVPAGIGSGS